MLQVRYKPLRQISLSSLGSLRASGASTLLAPVCSSALGRYVPSVCLFFFTTQKRNTRTAVKIANNPSTTVGTTMATILGPVLSGEDVVKLDIVEFSPCAKTFLTSSSRKLPANSPTCRIISGTGSICTSTLNQKGLMLRVGWRRAINKSCPGSKNKNSPICLLRAVSSPS